LGKLELFGRGGTKRVKTAIVWLGIAIGSALPLQAQQNSPAESGTAEVSAIEQQIRDLQDRIILLEGQMRRLQNAQPATAAVPAAAPPSAATAPAPEIPAAAATRSPDQNLTLGGAGGSAAKALNPDISVIGDFIGATGTGTVPQRAQQQPFPSLQMHE
jgi:hypothetical protein